MTVNRASARYEGFGKEGKGSITTKSGVLDQQPYGFGTRFEGQPGTNPEELIGAAHAGCYAMFLSALMSGEQITPESIEATSTIGLDPTTEGGPTVKTAHLVVKVKAPADESKIRELADKAKAGCPISKLLNATVTMEISVG